jgi:hypothetical protein
MKNGVTSLTPSISCKTRHVHQPSVQIALLPSRLEAIASLSDAAEAVYSQLCYFYEAKDEWVSLPWHLQKQVDDGLLNTEISQLQRTGLAIVAVEVRS